MLFIIRSVPLLNDTEEWNPILHEDIADMGVLRNKDSLKLVGWGKMDGITFIFTKNYRNRPESLKKIPSLKQMVMKDGVWKPGLQPLQLNGKRKENEIVKEWCFQPEQKRKRAELLYHLFTGKRASDDSIFKGSHKIDLLR